MQIRRPIRKDEQAVRELIKKYNWALPEAWAAAAVVENEERIIAFGCLRSIIEGILVVGGTNRENSLALIKLLEQAIKDAKMVNHNEIIVFAERPEFAEILERHFKFRRMWGTPMILEF